MTPTETREKEIICLVDDDSSLLKAMQRLLASDGIEVRAFSNPEEFLKHAAAHPVRVVVTDIWMKGVTGLEILARMCAISPRARVIVITGRDDLAARITVMQIGPVAFFPNRSMTTNSLLLCTTRSNGPRMRNHSCPRATLRISLGLREDVAGRWLRRGPREKE